MQLGGAWPEALEEARRAGERCAEGGNPVRPARPRYRQGEIRRVLGEDAAAEDCYREASRQGREPHPGLALLRLAQGRLDAAEAAIRRVEAETAARGCAWPAAAPMSRSCWRWTIARRRAPRATSSTSSRTGTTSRRARARSRAQARGALELAAGDARAAAAALRRAGEGWRSSTRPTSWHERVRWPPRRAERSATTTRPRSSSTPPVPASSASVPAPDLERLERLAAGGDSRAAHGLTARELEVLRQVAAGATNKADRRRAGAQRAHRSTGT